MKVLHVSAFDTGGGAARAAMRLHKALCGRGIESLFVTVKCSTKEAGVFSPLSKRQRLSVLMSRQAAMWVAALQKTQTNPVIHSLGQFSSGIGRWINESDVDVVNLHWIGAETLSINEIAQIKKPIVWTMHDMWPFTGTEHYDDLEYPERWKGPYTTASRPLTYSGPDIDAWVWGRKARAWAGKTFHLVAPSRWLAGCAASSALMAHQTCSVIANPLDTETFAPIEKQVARRILGLPEDKKLILFGALGATSDRRKGYDLLIEALQALERNHDVADVDVAVFGGLTRGDIPGVSMKSHFLGTFNDDLSLRLVYSAADIFVAPSRQDNLPNTVAEAAACGLPTVAFNIGGMSDIIINGKTGVLAPPFDTASLAEGIYGLIRAPIERQMVRAAAEAKVSLPATVPAYLALYEKLSGRSDAK